MWSSIVDVAGSLFCFIIMSLLIWFIFFLVGVPMPIEVWRLTLLLFSVFWLFRFTALAICNALE